MKEALIFVLVSAFVLGILSIAVCLNSKDKYYEKDFERKEKGEKRRMNNVIDLTVVTRSEKNYHDANIMEATIIEQENEIRSLNKTIAEKDYEIQKLKNELRKRKLR